MLLVRGREARFEVVQLLSLHALDCSLACVRHYFGEEKVPTRLVVRLAMSEARRVDFLIYKIMKTYSTSLIAKRVAGHLGACTCQAALCRRCPHCCVLPSSTLARAARVSCRLHQEPDG